MIGAVALLVAVAAYLLFLVWEDWEMDRELRRLQDRNAWLRRKHREQQWDEDDRRRWAQALEEDQ